MNGLMSTLLITSGRVCGKTYILMLCSEVACLEKVVANAILTCKNVKVACLGMLVTIVRCCGGKGRDILIGDVFLVEPLHSLFFIIFIILFVCFCYFTNSKKFHFLASNKVSDHEVKVCLLHLNQRMILDMHVI